MAFDFPASPTVGQIYTSGGMTYSWNGTVWMAVAAGSFLLLQTVFLASGTFTPDPSMLYCDANGWGGGGAGGGHGVTTTTDSVGGGGQAGAKSYARLTKAQIGASQVVTIGPGGVGVAANVGGDGGETSLGTLLRAAGGKGGSLATASLAASIARAPGVAVVQSPTGDIRGWTVMADCGLCTRDNTGVGIPAYGGHGAATEWGGGGIGATITTGGGGGGQAQSNTGSGGGGAAASNAQAAGRVGGNGAAGILVVDQYLEA